MKETLEAKLKLYRELRSVNAEFLSWLRESEVWMAEYSVLRVRGVEMDKRSLVEVLEGRLVQDIPLDIYSFVHSFKELYKEMQASLGMQESLNAGLLERFRLMLPGIGACRRDNPIIYRWGYIAPHFNEINDRLSGLFRALEREKDPLKKAVNAHNGIAAIYPYGEGSAVMAVVAMIYILMERGIPVPALTADSEEYDALMSEYFDKASDSFEQMFYRSLLNRLDSIIVFGLESRER